MLLITLLVSFFAFTGHVSAATWYFLRYVPKSGQKFTSFSGDMTIPPLPKAGVYYLWPGLQPTDNTGVYQNVLDGRSGTWWIGSGWCCSNPNLPWGSGFNTYANEKVTFNNKLDSSGSTWTSTLTRQSTGQKVTDSFPLGKFRYLFEIASPRTRLTRTCSEQIIQPSDLCHRAVRFYDALLLFKIRGLTDL